MRSRYIFALIALSLLAATAWAQSNSADQPQKKLGVVGTAHLDTQWRWTIKNTIDEYIPNTLHDNFKLFEIYPDYIFSFEGAFRYMLAKEYYPQDYETLKKYVAAGRWRVTGAWVDAVDVNIPSFESLVRHALYGNGFYKREFGKQSYDIFMPDCFGFGYALPSIAKHCGLRSFSTQKLTWGCSVPVPFAIGHWRGVDGSTLLSGLKTGNYVATFRSDLSRDTSVIRLIDELGDSSGCYAGYIYFGTGDVGGAPESLSVDWLTKSMRSDGPVKVSSIGADDLPNLVTEYPNAKLPTFDGELVMTRHGVGCYTSQAAMKRWNRRNELLADAAERAAVTASLFGGFTYPRQAFERAWTRFLWHQFHDDLTGTSIPEAYEFSWSDELLSLNEFSSALNSAVAAITPALDTRGRGETIVVYNPLAIDRQDVIEIPLPEFRESSQSIIVVGPGGERVPAQITVSSDGTAELQFLADVPSVGFAVYDLRRDEKAAQLPPITVTTSSMENERYRLSLNAGGDVASIYDKQLARELLAQPIELELIFNKPRQWPAWEIQYEDLLAGRRAKVEGTPKIEILESGAVRGALRITRQHGNSTYQTTIRMASGAAANRIDFVNQIDWAEKETLLKVAFRPAFANDSITYDLGLGTIKRGLNTPKKYEVPAHQWADFTAANGSAGLTILNDCKYGWDHPDSGTLRLTLIHTPGVFDSWSWVGDQSSQDIGRHEFTYSIVAHAGSWQSSDAPWQAARLNQPLIAYAAPQHEGQLGKSHSLLRVDPAEQVMVNAVKMSEAGDEVVVRVRELLGRPAEAVALIFEREIVSAREVNGQEEFIGEAVGAANRVRFSLTPYQPKAFAVKLKSANAAVVKPLKSQPLALAYNLDGISSDANRTDGNLDAEGNTLAAELLPDTLQFQGVRFTFGPKSDGASNVVACRGQKLDWKGNWNNLYLLLLATGGPQEGIVNVLTADGSTAVPVTLYEYTEKIGQWNNRMVNGQMVTSANEILPAYINSAPVAWAGTHRHTADGKNDTYKFTYLFAQRIPLPKGAQSIALPDNPHIKLLAASVSGFEHDEITPRTPHYDVASAALARIAASEPIFIDNTVVELSSPTPGALLRYTIDGSEPTSSSPTFDAPLRLASSTIVRARAFDRSGQGSVTTTLAVNKLIPRSAIEVAAPSAGLRCDYYEGEWHRLPNFDSLTAVTTFIANTVVIPEIARPEDYGLVFQGYIAVPADGMFEFGISSDDGSKLWVADTMIVDNDGLHGAGEIAGKVALTKGMHRLAVRMFQCKGGEALNLFITGPGIPKQEVGRQRLFH